MAGKWQKYRGKYPTYVEDPSFQQKVEEEKKRILCDAENPEDANITALAKQYVDARLNKEKLEAAVKAANVTLQAYVQILFDGMENDEMESVKMKGGVSIGLSDEPIPSTTDRAAVTEWALENDMKAILSVHFKTMQSIVKECILGGRAVPPGVSVFMKRGLRVTGLKVVGDAEE